MKIQSAFDENKGNWIVTLDGDLDLSSKEMFKNELERIYLAKEENIILKADELSYIDSSGLGVIIGALKKMRHAGHSIQIENPKDNIKKLLTITNLDRILL